MGFPGGSDGEESACNVGNLGSIPGFGRAPGGGHGNPLQYSCLENPHGQRSLEGYTPWGSQKAGHNSGVNQAQDSSGKGSFSLQKESTREFWRTMKLFCVMIM